MKAHETRSLSHGERATMALTGNTSTKLDRMVKHPDARVWQNEISSLRKNHDSLWTYKTMRRMAGRVIQLTEFDPEVEKASERPQAIEAFVDYGALLGIHVLELGVGGRLQALDWRMQQRFDEICQNGENDFDWIHAMQRDSEVQHQVERTSDYGRRIGAAYRPVLEAASKDPDALCDTGNHKDNVFKNAFHVVLGVGHYALASSYVEREKVA